MDGGPGEQKTPLLITLRILIWNYSKRYKKARKIALAGCLETFSDRIYAIYRDIVVNHESTWRGLGLRPSAATKKFVRSKKLRNIL